METDHAKFFHLGKIMVHCHFTFTEFGKTLIEAQKLIGEFGIAYETAYRLHAPESYREVVRRGIETLGKIGEE